jgi:hypothetical protein
MGGIYSATSTHQSMMAQRRLELLHSHIAATAAPAAAATGASQLWRASARATPEELRTFLRPLLPTAEDVRDWVGGDTSNRFPFGRYDRLLGYTHRPRDIVDGIDGAVSTYTYDELNARTQINGAGGRGRPVI